MRARCGIVESEWHCSIVGIILRWNVANCTVIILSSCWVVRTRGCLIWIPRRFGWPFQNSCTGLSDATTTPFGILRAVIRGSSKRRMKFQAKCTPENILSSSERREIRRTAILCSFGMHSASRRSYPSLENIVDSRRLVSEQEFYHGSNWTGSISPLATKNPYYHRSLTTRLDNRVLRLITPNSFRENRKLRVSRDYLSFLLSYILILGSLRWKSVCEFDESAAFALNNFVLTVTFDCLRLYDKIILLDNNNKIIIIDNNN